MRSDPKVELNYLPPWTQTVSPTWWTCMIRPSQPNIHARHARWLSPTRGNTQSLLVARSSLFLILPEPWRMTGFGHSMKIKLGKDQHLSSDAPMCYYLTIWEICEKCVRVNHLMLRTVKLTCKNIYRGVQNLYLWYQCYLSFIVI